MSTGKDYGLPEEYHDWVEKLVFEPHTFEPMVRIVTERCSKLCPNGTCDWTPLDVHTFVAPKPRPTLPDVKPGAVIRYRGANDRILRRAIRNPDRTTWTVWSEDLGLLHDKCADSGITEAVDDDGFTVELEGL